MNRFGVALKIFAIVCFVLLLWVGCASAATLVVSKTFPACTSGDEYFTSIQAAVDNAKEGDEIIVCPGTYKENIGANKSVSIRSYAGSSNTMIEAKNVKDNVITISANKVNISGFTIRNSEADGIYLEYVDGCNLSGNNIYSTNGISLFLSNNNTISRNTVKSNNNTIRGNNAKVYGIYLQLSNNNTITNNNASYNFFASNNNIIEENIISNSYGTGIWIKSSFNNVIRNNLVKLNNINGIELSKCSNNIIEENIISNNKVSIGVLLDDSSSNIIRNNTIKFNYMGIHLSSSYNNTIEENTVSENTEDGIFLYESHNNIIKNNNIKSNDNTGIDLSLSINNIIEKNTALDNLNGIKSSWFSNNIIIKDNIVKSNAINGIWLRGSSNNNTIERNIVSDNFQSILLEMRSNDNIIKNNIIKSNKEYGIALIDSDNNFVEENIASDNDNGIFLDYSHYNIIKSNIIKSNHEIGISLYSSNYTLLENNNISISQLEGVYLAENSIENLIYHNNIIDNDLIDIKWGRQRQVFDGLFDRRNNWHHPELLEGNYWSDYFGVDDGSGGRVSGDGIGDTEIPHPDFGYDYYPYMNKSGWLTFLVSPEYWEFGDVYPGDIKPKQTFELQNRGKDDLTILNITSDEDVEISGIELPANITAGENKTFTVKINTKNLEGDILKTLEIVSNDKITPTKTILMYGFVKLYTPGVRVEKPDFENRVIKGQIDLFRISVNNTGVANETNITVNFTVGDTVSSKEIPELKKNETKTVKFKWDTANAFLGIHEIKIEVISRKGELLDRLKLRVYVLPTTKASTFIVANLKRMADKWGNDNITELEEKLIELSFHPSVNGIVVRVENETNCSKIYEEWDEDKSPEKANEIAKTIKGLIYSKFKEYPNIEYLIIVGDDRIIPFYRIFDNSGYPTENKYPMEVKVNIDSTVGFAIYNNMFLTDNFYATNKSTEWKTPDGNISELFIPNIPVSRLVETPEEISAVIEAFYHKEYVRPEKIFVTAYDFMWDTALHCSSTLEEKTKTKPKTIISRDKSGLPPDSFENATRILLNTSNDVILLFYHANHYQFSAPDPITSRDFSTAPADLNGSIVYSMSCHAGLNVPPNSSDNDFDLVQAFAQKGVVAYVAPTGYGIGSYQIRAAHELLLSYFTNYLCEGIDVGTALMLAKQEFWATNYDFDYFDEQVLGTTTLYGLPMAKITIPYNITSRNESMMTIKSIRSVEEQPDTLVIRPTHVLNITRDGDYYITPCEELLSCLNIPILPKEIRIFHPTHKRALRGAVMTSAKYRIDEPFKPLIEGYQKSNEPQESAYGEIKNWFPAKIFKLNSIRYPGPHAESRQYLIIITGQYKGPIGEPIREHLFTISNGELKEELNKGIVPERLKNMFKVKGNPLSKNITLINRSDGNWTITDKDEKKIYFIRYYKWEKLEELFIEEEKSGKERIYDELSFDLYYASPDKETKPPEINNVSHERINHNITITVNASDKSGIRRVLVTYTYIDGERGEWRSEDCKHEEGDLWTCNIHAEEGIEFFVQAVDGYGNVAIKDNDGKYFKK